MSHETDAAARLRQQVTTSAQALAEKALREGAPPPQAELERLGALAKLAELAVARPAARRARAPALVFAATLAVASVLLFARVGQTEVEIEAVVDGVQFTLAARQPLTETLVLHSLGAAGMREAVWPPTAGASAPAGAAVRVTASAPAPVDASVTLPSLVLAEAATVQVQAAPQGFHVALQPAPASVSVSLLGEVTLQAGSSDAQARNFRDPEPMLLRGGGEWQLALEPAAAQAPFALPLRVSRLGFERVDVAQQGTQALVRRLSTLSSGHLRRLALASEPHPLRRGETLRLEIVHGTLQRLEVDGGRLAINFHGVVREIGAGSDDNPRSLMPTWLEWLRARHGLSLLWGSALYAFGMAMAAWRWWTQRT